jgi:uncharacterized membrane protein
LATFVGSAAWAGPSFTFTDLGPGEEPSINDFGAVAYSLSDPQTTAIVYHPTSGVFEIGLLPNGTNTRATAIGNNGQVVGGGDTVKPPFTFRRALGWIWDSINGLRDIGTLPGFGNSIIRDMNDRGVAVGFSRNSDPRLDLAFIFSESEGLTNLGVLPGFDRSFGSAINNHNEVIGSLFSDTSFEEISFFWNASNGMIDLDARIGVPTVGRVNAINDAGEIVGQYGDPGRAFLWSESGGFVDVGVLPGRRMSNPRAINERSQIVGGSGPAASPGWLWEHGDLYELNEITIDLPEFYRLAFANDINNVGQIVGRYVVVDGTGRRGIYLLTPVESPQIVTIDVKPGSFPNCLNINGNGVIPVAVLGSDSLDVTSIDLNELLFGGMEVRVRGNKGPLCGIEDVNSDTHDDLVCHFQDEVSNWEPGDDEATLTGVLLDGTRIEGTDTICIVP